MRTILHIVLAVAVLAGGSFATWMVFVTAPEPETDQRVEALPLVRVQRVQPGQETLRVETHGTVVPRTEIDLVPEVGGRVVWISPALWPGGFFEPDEVLVKIDPRDFELRVTRARAEVARAKVALARELAEAETAQAEWAKLQPDRPASPLVKHEPQLADAQAQLAAAVATLDQAELDLSRTVVVAPFAGRVRTKRVDVGQFVVAGVGVADLYAVDYAEVRLPLPDYELAFVELPLRSPGGEDGTKVILSAEFAGQVHRWDGWIARVEGEIDTRTRMVYAVARVPDPYDRRGDRGGAPLAAGLFVNAEIIGHTYQDVIAVPRSALRSDGRLLVVGPYRSKLEVWTGPGVDDFTVTESAGWHITFREVDILRRESGRILVRSGLEPGELVCTSPLEVVTQWMRVEFLEESDPPPVSAPGPQGTPR